MIGIRILPGLLLNGGFEIKDALFLAAVLIEQKSIAVVEADIGGIPAQAFQIVVGGLESGMAVLLQMGRPDTVTPEISVLTVLSETPREKG